MTHRGKRRLPMTNRGKRLRYLFLDLFLLDYNNSSPWHRVKKDDKFGVRRDFHWSA